MLSPDLSLSVRSGPQLIYEFQQTLAKWRELIPHRNAQVQPGKLVAKVLTGQVE
jgi:hypothetical protein